MESDLFIGAFAPVYRAAGTGMFEREDHLVACIKCKRVQDILEERRLRCPECGNGRRPAVAAKSAAAT